MKKSEDHLKPENRNDRTTTVAAVFEETFKSAYLLGMMEQLGYQTILVNGNLDNQQIRDVSVEIIFMEVQSWCPLIEQKLERLKTVTRAPVLCIIDPNHPDSRSDKVFNVCDDFILKPFSPEELILRIRWIVKNRFRKASFKIRDLTGADMNMVSGKPDEIQKPGFFAIDEAAKLVFIKGQRVHLTPKEYNLFCLLASSVGKIFSNQEIISEIWKNGQNATDKDVQQYIYSLRKKIEQDASKPRFLINVPGFGYKLESEDNIG